MIRATIAMRGLSAYVQHNARLADPDDPIVQEIGEINAKTKKTTLDRNRRADLEWEGGLYVDAEGYVVVPHINVLKWLRDGAAAERLGPKIHKAVIVEEPEIRLHSIEEMDGAQLLGKPFKVDAIRGAAKHRLILVVSTDPRRKTKGTRCRPQFPKWGLDVPVAVHDDLLDKEQLERVVHWASLEGFGDGRKIGYGKCIAEVKWG